MAAVSDREIQRLIAAVEKLTDETHLMRTELATASAAFQYQQRQLDDHSESIRNLFGRINKNEVQQAQTKPATENNQRMIFFIWGLAVTIVTTVINKLSG